MSDSWLTVDRKGLAALLEKKGKAFAIFELLQNAWDTETETVSITLEKINGRPLAKLVVEDEDPDGFFDLTHAYTMFARSTKLDNPEKRGRFNIGEKLVLALCKEATISSTKGTVVFKEDGTRSTKRVKRESGSRVEMIIKMNKTEFIEVENAVATLIPPSNIKTIYNDVELLVREPIGEAEISLPTMKADSEGNLSRTVRKTVVKFYDPLSGEEPYIYEMGIPVVATGDRYHIDVQQKVPLNMDRDNVSQKYLQKVRVEALNATINHMTEDEVAQAWVMDAISHKDVTKDAVNTVLDKKYGKMRAIYDPSDREANNRLTGQGYAVIHGRSLSGDAWENVKRYEAAQPSGVISPTQSENHEKSDIIRKGDYTDGINRVIELTHILAQQLMGIKISVLIVRALKTNVLASYGSRQIVYNLGTLGHSWFDRVLQNNFHDFVSLAIHEFAHEYSSNHLDKAFYNKIEEMAGKAFQFALEEPEIFKGE